MVGHLLSDSRALDRPRVGVAGGRDVFIAVIDEQHVVSRFGEGVCSKAAPHARANDRDVPQPLLMLRI
jgi:hypothetical protein